MERLLVIIIGTFFSLGVQAKTCTLKSPDHKVALIELYTSEGCSSCPPADKWLSRLDNQGQDGSQVVPLSLHVDYWNYIGWKDPYSSAQYTSRQREIGFRNRLRSIYTPQLVFQGRDFRSWRNVDFPSLLKQVNAQKADGDIHFSIAQPKPGTFDIQVNASVRDISLHSNSRLLVAIYENNLSSSVTAGENNGRLLEHDYVVRKLYSAREMDSRGAVANSFTLVVPPQWNEANLGLAAFIEDPTDGIVQAFSSKLVCG